VHPIGSYCTDKQCVLLPT